MTSAMLTGCSWVGQGWPCSDQAMTSKVEAGVTQTVCELMSAVQRHPVLKAVRHVDMVIQMLIKYVVSQALKRMKVSRLQAFVSSLIW